MHHLDGSDGERQHHSTTPLRQQLHLKGEPRRRLHTHSNGQAVSALDLGHDGAVHELAGSIGQKHTDLYGIRRHTRIHVVHRQDAPRSREAGPHGRRDAAAAENDAKEIGPDGVIIALRAIHVGCSAHEKVAPHSRTAAKMCRRGVLG